MYWNVYGDIQTGSENLRFSIGTPTPLSTQGVIVNIPAA